MRPPSPAVLAAKAEERLGAETGVMLSRHARQRAREMGATRAQVEQLVLRYDVSRPSKDGRDGRDAVVSVCDELPSWAAVWKQLPGCRLVLTLVFRTGDDYSRAGAGFEVR